LGQAFIAPERKPSLVLVLAKSPPHCHFERQREIFNNQDSSSLSLPGMTAAEASKIILNIVEFLGSILFRRDGIFAESNSKKHPHCHFERQREIFNNQDSSSLSLPGMTES